MTIIVRVASDKSDRSASALRRADLINYVIAILVESLREKLERVFNNNLLVIANPSEPPCEKSGHHNLNICDML